MWQLAPVLDAPSPTPVQQQVPDQLHLLALLLRLATGQEWTFREHKPQ